MEGTPQLLALEAFKNAAARVPAYRVLLQEAGMRVQDVRGFEDFQRLPILGKHNTFQRFAIHELCKDGALARPESVLTSSGHSGVFAFGLTDVDASPPPATWIDDALDALFAVRSRPTLLINCLPMGVKVHTRACTLAETSIRPDMVVGIMKKLAGYFTQIVVIGEAAFVKHALELGIRSGVDWRSHRINIILGEEPLAENARRYLGGILGHDVKEPQKGIIFSSMGVAELGLNLFFEVPPVAPLVVLRGCLHENHALREAILGPAQWVPSIFTYDPERIFVEFEDSGRLILTTLDLNLRIPLVRYATGDQGAFVSIPEYMKPAMEERGLPWDVLKSLPMVIIYGRGDFALAGEGAIYPEAVKEGIYHDPELAEKTTANFRLRSDPAKAVIRIQLSDGVAVSRNLESAFASAISHYVTAPYTVVCESYETFRSGMALDYERKFQYLGP